MQTLQSLRRTRAYPVALLAAVATAVPAVIAPSQALANPSDSYCYYNGLSYSEGSVISGGGYELECVNYFGQMRWWKNRLLEN